MAMEQSWFEFVTGFVVTYDGKLIPSSTKAASELTDEELFEQFVPYPVAECKYIAPVIDTGFDDTLRIYAPVIASPGSGIVGTPNITTYLDTWLTGQMDEGLFQLWVIGYVLMRYMRMSLVMIPGTVPGYVEGFIPTADTGADTIRVENVTVAPGGTRIDFPQPFHAPPVVIPGAIADTSLTATAFDVDELGFTGHIFNTVTGADVGGTMSYLATGE